MSEQFRKSLGLSALSAALVLGGLGCCSHHRHHNEEMGDEHEEKVDVATLPAAVKTAVTQAVPNGQITDAEKETDDGKTVYELDVKDGAKAYELKVTPEGKVVSNKEDTDEHEKM